MKECKWMPLLIIGVLTFIIGGAWVNYFQEVINAFVKDPVQAIIYNTIFTVGITVLGFAFIIYLARCWNNRDHWIGSRVFCDEDDEEKQR